MMGFFLLMAAGNDSTKATYCSGMRAIMEDPEQRALLLEDPSLVPDAVEESLRMFPAFAHFRRTATCDTELHGQKIKEGEKVVMWYVSSNRDETRYEDPDRFDLRRKAEHQAFGAGGRHFCLGTALARLELRILIEETLERYPEIAIDGEPPALSSNRCSSTSSRRCPSAWGRAPPDSELHHHLAGVAAGEQEVQRLGRMLEALDDVLARLHRRPRPPIRPSRPGPRGNRSR